MNMTSAVGGGAGGFTYTNELRDGLLRVASGDALSEFSFRRRFSRERRVLRSVDTLHHQIFWLNHTLPRQIRDQNLDVFHNPSSHIPLRCPVPLVATLCDLYAIRNPSAFRGWHGIAARFFAREALARADRIITISEFTRREVLEVFGSEYEAKITRVHLAAHPRFSDVSAEAREAVARTYQLDKPYVLCVSTIEPRKNFEGILEAFARIQNRVEHELVIVGGKGWKQERLNERIEGLGLTDRVRFLGYVDLADLPGLYAQADLFAYPSFYEGFGLPILEAMGCGCPVLTSDAASMPEVAGDAAVLVDPTRVEDMAQKLEATLRDAAARARLSAKGRARAATFSWDRCAQETLAVYRSVG